MNKVAAFALRRKNSILSMSEKLFCPPQPLRFWITPACAGKSRARKAAAAVRRDHPRVCGEKTMACSILRPMRGSPPRMRGKDRQGLRVQRFAGITPAYAGKSAHIAGAHPQSRDHPRVCGEKRLKELICDMAKGSPPRMRGKEQHSLSERCTRRITPAYAGKRCRERFLFTDH